MTFWIKLLVHVFYLSSHYVGTFRLQNYVHNNRPLVRHSSIEDQAQTNCYPNDYTVECPVLPKNTLLKMLINAHARKVQHQNERLLQRLFEKSRNHKIRRGHIENLSPPLLPLAYPKFTKNPSAPSNWPLQHSTTNLNQLGNPLFRRTTTDASFGSLFTNVLPNKEIISKRPLTDISRWRKTIRPEIITGSDLNSFVTTPEPPTAESTYKTTLYNYSTPTEIADKFNHNLYQESSETTTTNNTALLAKLVETTLLPLNVTPLIYNVEIEVNTKSDEKSMIQNFTINAFTKVPIQPTDAFHTLSTNLLNGVVRENRTLSIASNDTGYKLYSPPPSALPAQTEAQRMNNSLVSYSAALDKLERRFYATTFNKLTSMSPEGRQENGISFVQSGLFLSLHLMAFSTETDEDTKAEIDKCLGLNITDAEKINITQDVLSKLPKSSFDLKWRWVSRLILGPTQNVSEEFRCGAASALNVLLGKFNGNETDEMLAGSLNRMVEEDSGGAIRNTFEPDELSGGVRAVAVTTLYMRARWRSAPTVLNGTRPFLDAAGVPPRTVRMIRINDYMRYANFEDWSFKAIEIFYATRGLSLLMLVPHGRSLRELAARLETVSVAEILRRMITMRIAVTMPIYTLRMTLLLPSKLRDLGVNKLISDNNATDSGRLKLSHAVQRLMFWAEAGRNAFKDDGIEWDPDPELELVVDRPYLFFVRWHNITIMNASCSPATPPSILLFMNS